MEGRGAGLSQGGQEQRPSTTQRMTDGKKFLEDLQNDPQSLVVLVSILVGVLTLLVVFFLSRRRARGRTVILSGSCEAGKTTMLAQLLYNKEVETYTSAKQNEGLYNPPGKSALRLVDIPGHERLRMDLVSRVLESSGGRLRGLIYVVDSTSLQKQLRDVAVFLYGLLTSAVVHQAGAPVLVACNKQDLALSKGSSVIRRELEKELQLLRTTQAGTLEGTDAASAKKISLGKDGTDFSFDNLVHEVTFAEVSSLSHSEGGLHEVKAWLSKIA